MSDRFEDTLRDVLTIKRAIHTTLGGLDESVRWEYDMAAMLRAADGAIDRILGRECACAETSTRNCPVHQ